MSQAQYFRTTAATDLDGPLLLQLFVDSRAEQFAPLGLTPDQLHPLLAGQFRAQQLSYASAYPDAFHRILVLEDGTGIGHVLFAETAESLRVIDLAVLRDYRNRKLGAMAIQHVQRIAASRSLPVGLRVRKDSPARRLYMRQGFRVGGEDALDLEMEWSLARNEGDLPKDEVVRRCIAFLREIGLVVEFGKVDTVTFLPGIQVVRNGLRIDVEHLLYPGDLLHEAGHLAVMPTNVRFSDNPEPTDQGEEIAATAWSYAAAVHLGIPVTQVIHDNGLRGSASVLREMLSTDRGPGVPLLGWMGLTICGSDRGKGLYPHMLGWVRA